MLSIISGIATIFKPAIAYMGTSIIGIAASAKSYAAASYLLAKPLMGYALVRGTWITGIAVIEWYSGRIYAINCIGEGFHGFYNHIWNLASPACTGLLISHVSLIGALLSSFIITTLFFIYSGFNKIKQNKISEDILKEYYELKSLVSK